MLIHWAMVEYLPFAAYSVANKGVYKHTSENASVKRKKQTLIEKKRDLAQYYTDRFISYMSFNNSDFPEYIQALMKMYIQIKMLFRRMGFIKKDKPKEYNITRLKKYILELTKNNKN